MSISKCSFFGLEVSSQMTEHQTILSPGPSDHLWCCSCRVIWSSYKAITYISDLESKDMGYKSHMILCYVMLSFLFTYSSASNQSLLKKIQVLHFWISQSQGAVYFRACKFRTDCLLFSLKIPHLKILHWARNTGDRENAALRHGCQQKSAC